MPISSMPWIKLPTEFLDNPRINMLPEEFQRRFIWLELLAGKLDAGGAIIEDGRELPDIEIAYRLRITPEEFQETAARLIGDGFLSFDKKRKFYEVVGWMDVQGPTQESKRIAWNKRQKEHKQKENKEKLTRESRVIHVSRGEESRAEESRAEESRAEAEQKREGTQDEEPEAIPPDLPAAALIPPASAATAERETQDEPGPADIPETEEELTPTLKSGYTHLQEFAEVFGDAEAQKIMTLEGKYRPETIDPVLLKVITKGKQGDVNRSAFGLVKKILNDESGSPSPITQGTGKKPDLCSYGNQLFLKAENGDKGHKIMFAAHRSECEICKNSQLPAWYKDL